MKLIKTWNGYKTTDGKYSITLTSCRIKNLYPKYYVCGEGNFTHVSTLKEAKAYIEDWEKEVK